MFLCITSSSVLQMQDYCSLDFLLLPPSIVYEMHITRFTAILGCLHLNTSTAKAKEEVAEIAEVYKVNDPLSLIISVDHLIS